MYPIAPGFSSATIALAPGAGSFRPVPRPVGAGATTTRCREHGAHAPTTTQTPAGTATHAVPAGIIAKEAGRQ